MGHPRIARDVLKGIRQYLLVDNGDDILVKRDRVQSTVKEVEKNPTPFLDWNKLLPSLLMLTKGKV